MVIQPTVVSSVCSVLGDTSTLTLWTYCSRVWRFNISTGHDSPPSLTVYPPKMHATLSSHVFLDYPSGRFLTCPLERKYLMMQNKMLPHQTSIQRWEAESSAVMMMDVLSLQTCRLRSSQVFNCSRNLLLFDPKFHHNYPISCNFNSSYVFITYFKQFHPRDVIASTSECYSSSLSMIFLP
jgi:hypothetical protein